MTEANTPSEQTGDGADQSSSEYIDDGPIIILGPTAAGKTAAAMAIQDWLGGPSKARLISADSAMIYRGMDIGTAQPTANELVGYPHDLIDILDPTQRYSAADFVADADACIARAIAKGQRPIVVGGTMLYIRCLLNGIATLPESDPEQARALEQELQRDGSAAMHDELLRFDPAAAANIHPNNHQRLLRAVEVIRRTGQPLSQQWQESPGLPLELRLGVSPRVAAIVPRDRAALHQRIAQRFDAMLHEGFLDEVRALRQRSDIHLDLPAMRAVGYRQAWRHLDGKTDAAAFREQAVAATRQLAKRQLTWIRQWPGMPTVHADLLEPALQSLRELLRINL